MGTIEKTFTLSYDSDEYLESLIAQECNNQIAVYQSIMMDDSKYYSYMERQDEDLIGYDYEFFADLDNAFSDEAPVGCQLTLDLEGEEE